MVKSILIKDDLKTIFITFESYEETLIIENELKKNNLFFDYSTGAGVANSFCFMPKTYDEAAKLLDFFAGKKIDWHQDNITTNCAIAHAILNTAQVSNVSIQIPERFAYDKNFLDEFDLAFRQLFRANPSAINVVSNNLPSLVTREFLCKLMQEGLAAYNHSLEENRVLTRQLEQKHSLENTAYSPIRFKTATKIQSIFKRHITQERFKKIEAEIIHLTAAKQHILARKLQNALRDNDWKAASEIIENKNEIIKMNLQEMKTLKLKVIDDLHKDQELNAKEINHCSPR